MLYYTRLIFKRQTIVLIKRTFQGNCLVNLKPEERIEKLRKMAQPLARDNPVIMKLDTPVFKSIFSEELNTLARLFERYGFEIRIAGGAVRDILMEKKPKDLDFATTATPEQMKDMFTKENVRMINAKGEKHGTITPRINNKENFEVTTLRIDVVTDGRHAEVQYTTDWLLDANRRDLTINSMFLDLDGSLYDYFYGYEDLKNNRVVFVGDAETRIQEDYLRILRYFRFYGKIAKDVNSHDKKTLEAIRENAAGLEKISGERIWMELKKILEGNFAGELMLLIVELGVHQHIGLPSSPDIEELKTVWNKSKSNNLNAITLLSSLLKTEDEVSVLNSRLKLSVYERELAYFVVRHRKPKISTNPLFPYKELVMKSKSKLTFTKEWALEVLKYQNSPHINEFETWTIPKFPVNGALLKKEGIESGKFMGSVMNELKKLWIDSEFKLESDELMCSVPDIVDRLKSRKKC